MKTLRKAKRAVPLVVATFGLACLVSQGCQAPQSSAPVAKISMPTYIIPSTLDTFNAGQVHNAGLYYIYTHYDTNNYAGYPDKFSEQAVDSLAALFIADSLETASGPLSPSEIAEASDTFNSTFHRYLTSLPTHAEFVASVDTAEARGILASDEATFLITADTDILLCTSYDQIKDTVISLINQYHSVSNWQPSFSHGVDAYEYLSIANYSCHFWSEVNTKDTLSPPVSIDAKVQSETLLRDQSLVSQGLMTETQALLDAQQAGYGASAATSTNPPGHPPDWHALAWAAIITAVIFIGILLLSGL